MGVCVCPCKCVRVYNDMCDIIHMTWLCVCVCVSECVCVVWSM